MVLVVLVVLAVLAVILLAVVVVLAVVAVLAVVLAVVAVVVLLAAVVVVMVVVVVAATVAVTAPPTSRASASLTAGRQLISCPCVLCCRWVPWVGRMRTSLSSMWSSFRERWRMSWGLWSMLRQPVMLRP